eukprot:sb/3462027/
MGLTQTSHAFEQRKKNTYPSSDCGLTAQGGYSVHSRSPLMNLSILINRLLKRNLSSVTLSGIQNAMSPATRRSRYIARVSAPSRTTPDSVPSRSDTSTAPSTTPSALTRAVICRRWRERKKLTDPTYLVKKRLANQRERAQLSQEKRLERLRKDRERKRAKRTTPLPSGTPFKRVQEEGKALTKLSLNLPTTPRRRSYTLKMAAEKFGLDAATTTAVSAETDRSTDHSTDHPEFAAIRDFFFRTDISYTMPGMGRNDTVSILVQGVRQRVTRHYLNYSLREAHQVYLSENPDCTIRGFSKFASLRPRNVFFQRDTPFHQCQCLIHENYRFLLQSCGVKPSELFQRIFCSSEEKDMASSCWLGTCAQATCGVEQLKRLPEFDDIETVVKWREWTKLSEDGRLKLVEKRTSKAEVVYHVVEKYTQYKEHVRVKRIQSSEFRKDQEASLEGDIRVIQIDFSMSYITEQQDEVQAGLWSRTTVMLFTAAVWFRGVVTTYLIVSDSTVKDKDTISNFLVKLFETFPEQTPPPREIIWSDGPSAEFKNKYMVNQFMGYLGNQLQRSLSWKFFCTSHGKGVVDGIGGTSKTAVRTAVRSRCSIVQDATDFFNVVKAKLTKTKVLLIKESDILRPFLTWGTPGVKGIRSKHVFHWDIGLGTTKAFDDALVPGSGNGPPVMLPSHELNNCAAFPCDDVDTDPDLAAMEKHWVVARYVLGDTYQPAVVIDIEEDPQRVRLRFLDKIRSKGWRFPRSGALADEWCSVEDIKLCSVLALVGVDTHKKLLSHLVSWIIGQLKNFNWSHSDMASHSDTVTGAVIWKISSTESSHSPVEFVSLKITASNKFHPQIVFSLDTKKLFLL